jgi:hypothetical protein
VTTLDFQKAPEPLYKYVDPVRMLTTAGDMGLAVQQVLETLQKAKESTVKAVHWGEDCDVHAYIGVMEYLSTASMLWMAIHELLRSYSVGLGQRAPEISRRLAEVEAAWQKRGEGGSDAEEC